MKFTDLSKIYGAAGRELRSILLSIDPASFDGAQAEQVKAKCRRVVRYLNVVAGRWTYRMAREAYAKSEVRTLRILERIGKRIRRNPKSASGGAAPVQAEVEATLLKSNGSIMQTVEKYCAVVLEAGRAARNIPVIIKEFSDREAYEEIDRMATDAMRAEASRGKLMMQIKDFLAELIADENLITITGKDGITRNYNLRKYARMVARTTLAKAQTQATLDLSREYDNDLVQVSDHSTDCAECEEYEGNIYSLSGSSRFPRLPASPPYHPNCRHGLLPTSEAELRVREREKTR